MANASVDDGIGLGCATAFMVILVVGAVGWVANIAKLFLSLNDPLTGMFFARIVGVFLVPIGCIVGWL